MIYPDRDWAWRFLEAMPDLVCVCDNGRITYVNPAGVRLLGFRSSRRLLGQTLTDFVVSDDREAVSRLMAGTGKRRKPATVRLVRATKRDAIVEMWASPLPDHDIAGTIVQAHDCTARTAAEAELLQARAELEARVADGARALTTETADRRRAEDGLRLAGRVIHTLHEAVVIADRDFRVSSVNPAFTEITGYAPEEVLGLRAQFLDAIEADEALSRKMWRSLGSEGRWEGECWNQRNGGEGYAQHLSLVAISDENGSVTQYAAVLSDITKRKQDEERILYQANFDALTGLPNRTLFLDRLIQSMANCDRPMRKVALLFIDLDGFKLVNDTLGHDVGDQMLKEAARRLVACVRNGDTVARLGGDEFTVIMPDLKDMSSPPVVAQRVLDSLTKAFHLKNQEFFVSASIGITVYPDDGENANDLLRNADTAMYRVKDHGKAHYQFFTTDMNDGIKDQLVLKNGLAKALERQEFELFYQPKLEIRSGRITGVEALMRWSSPNLGLVPPDKFIPILEETGQVIEVGEWVIRAACAQHRAWLDAGFPPIPIAVNLSARQLREAAFVAIVERGLNDTRIAPNGLHIEITESMLMSDAEQTVIALRDLHDMGIHMAIDDFGTGYSSLSYLKKFPIDTIKIDRSFVADIATSPDDAEIIRTIINMGQTMNRRVVAEGVETQDQLGLLSSYLCDEIQGYLFSPPLPSDEATRFLGEYFNRPS